MKVKIKKSELTVQNVKSTCFENFHSFVNYSILSQNALHEMIFLELYSLSLYKKSCAFTVIIVAEV